MRTSTRLTPMRGSTPPASSTRHADRRPLGLVHDGDELGAVGAGQREHAAPHRLEPFRDRGLELGNAVEERAEVGVRMHGGERGAPALEHRRALAAALERRGGRGRDEPGEERRREALPVDHDRLAPVELRQQVLAALAGAAAAHDPARDLVAQVLAERGLRIEAGVDQEQARRRLASETASAAAEA